MSRVPFSQTVVGAVVVAVIAGLIVLVVELQVGKERGSAKTTKVHNLRLNRCDPSTVLILGSGSGGGIRCVPGRSTVGSLLAMCDTRKGDYMLVNDRRVACEE